jgi:hypothetical protein
MVKILLVSRQLNYTVKILAEHLFNQNYHVEILTSKNADLSKYKTHVPIRAYFKNWNWMETAFLANEFIFQPPKIIHFFDFGEQSQITTSFKLIAHLARLHKSTLSYSFFEQNYRFIPNESSFFKLFDSVSFPSSIHINDFRKTQRLNSKPQIYYLPYLFDLNPSSDSFLENSETASNLSVHTDKSKLKKLLQLRSPYWLAYIDQKSQAQFIKSSSANILLLKSRTPTKSPANVFYLPDDAAHFQIYISQAEKVIIKDANITNHQLNLLVRYCQKFKVPFEIEPSLNHLLWSHQMQDEASLIDQVLNKQTRIYENALN